jgi:hypothetical protein
MRNTMPTFAHARSTDVAKSLIEAGIRLAIKEEWLDKEDLQKVQRPK